MRIGVGNDIKTRGFQILFRFGLIMKQDIFRFIHNLMHLRPQLLCVSPQFGKAGKTEIMEFRAGLQLEDRKAAAGLIDEFPFNAVQPVFRHGFPPP